jgi:molybdopterin-guanine dinucleotide biosynthesis protein A
MEQVSISILCGGQARRFGMDKSFFNYRGKPLYRYAYDELSPLTDDIFLQCGKKDTHIYEVCSYNDHYLDLGPIGGIYSALRYARYPRVFVIACDMPHITRRFVTTLLEYHGDIVVPGWDNGYVEPLCAVYSRKLAPLIEYKMLQGDYKIATLFDEVDVKHVAIEPLMAKGIIPEEMFKNINYPDDV